MALKAQTVFFLAENSILRNSKSKNLYEGDLKRIKNAFAKSVVD